MKAAPDHAILDPRSRKRWSGPKCLVPVENATKVPRPSTMVNGARQMRLFNAINWYQPVGLRKRAFPILNMMLGGENGDKFGTPLHGTCNYACAAFVRRPHWPGEAKYCSSAALSSFSSFGIIQTTSKPA